MNNPYLCEDCFAQREARRRFDASNPPPDNRKKDAEMLAEWDAERDAAIAALRHRHEPVMEAPDPTFTSTYAADERAAAAARADRRAQIAGENAERQRLDGTLWAAGLSTEIQPREMAASPLLFAAVERIAAERQAAGKTGVDPAAACVAARIRRESIVAGMAARESMIADAPEPVRVVIEQQIRQSDRAAGRELAFTARRS